MVISGEKYMLKFYIFESYFYLQMCCCFRANLFMEAFKAKEKEGESSKEYTDQA